MKISVIMIDGGFREHIFGPEYFSKQDFPEDEYEVIWVEYYDKPNSDVLMIPNVKVITLNRSDIYHSSYCFNRGIRQSQGEIIVIPDGDQIVKPDFLLKVWNIHSQYDKLVLYGYRYDEIEKGALKSFAFDELEKKCILKNPTNYGGCLTVRKKWLLKVNGYEQHPLFRTGHHANGLDMYTRFKNIGLAIQWEPALKLYHPWHDFSLVYTKEQEVQKKLIEWRKKHLQWQAFEGIDPARNLALPHHAARLLKSAFSQMQRQTKPQIITVLRELTVLFNNTLSKFRQAAQ